MVDVYAQVSIGVLGRRDDGLRVGDRCRSHGLPVPFIVVDDEDDSGDGDDGRSRSVGDKRGEKEEEMEVGEEVEGE
mgnify:CR=1 FL=1